MATQVRDAAIEKLFPPYNVGDDYREVMKREEAALEKLRKDGTPVIRFPRADGYAMYAVKSMKPLRLVHLPIGDAWQIDKFTMRGLRAADVEQLVKQENALNKLFGGKKANA